MFIDKLKLSLQAGNGGNGVVAWRREKYVPKGGPSGGNGGNGGSVIIKVNESHFSFENLRNKRLIKAENGKSGQSSRKKGKVGKNIILEVPPGTIIKNSNTNEILLTLDSKDQEQIVICKGGYGGLGNSCFKTAQNQAPNYSTKGKLGENIELELELKIIADIGLVGMPNAGKSTFISKVTNAHVKIAPYPFTTLHPNIGVLEFDDFSRAMIADIPGIIKNAHKNKGLGFSFLKHIERSKVLVFIIDISEFTGSDSIKEFEELLFELKSYDKTLLEKPHLVLLNKIDLIEDDSKTKNFKKKFPEFEILEISALERSGLDLALDQIQKKLKN
jgi:GTPase